MILAFDIYGVVFSVTNTAFRNASAERFFVLCLNITLYFFLIFFFISVAEHILTALSLYKISKKRGLSNAFLSWFPVANCYIMGALVKEHDAKRGINGNRKMILFIPWIMVGVTFILLFMICIVPTGNPGTLVSAVMILIDIAELIIPAVYTAVFLICYFKIFESMLPEKAFKYTVIGALVPLGMSICLFKCQNKAFAGNAGCEMTGNLISASEEKEKYDI